MYGIICLITLCILCIIGADHSAIDIFGCKPLHIACTKQLLEVAKILLDKGNSHVKVTVIYALHYLAIILQLL